MTDQVSRPHFEGLDTAFLQLSLALKLWHFLSCHPELHQEIDIDLTTTGEDGGAYVTVGGEFESADNLIIAAGNNIAICYGAAAITLWEAIREKTEMQSREIDPAVSSAHATAALAYSVRCCFAHGTVEPRWDLKPKYQITYRLGNREIDLTNAHRTTFAYSQLGGIDAIRLLRDQAEAQGLL